MLNLTFGILILILGILILIYIFKKILAGKQIKIGDYRLLLGGIGFIVGGIILVIKNLSYSTPTDGERVLMKNLNLILEKGQHLLITGK